MVSKDAAFEVAYRTFAALDREAQKTLVLEQIDAMRAAFVGGVDGRFEAIRVFEVGEFNNDGRIEAIAGPIWNAKKG